MTNSRDNRKSCVKRESGVKRDGRVKRERESRGVTAESAYQEGLAFSQGLYTNAERIATEHSYSFLQQRVQLGKTSVLTESILSLSLRVCVCVCARAHDDSTVQRCMFWGTWAERGEEKRQLGQSHSGIGQARPVDS